MRMVSNLGDHTGYWLRMVSNAVSYSFARKVAAEGVTIAEWALMRVLYGGSGIAPSVLAERMGMTRGAISKLADRLVAKDLVTRADNPEDRRAHNLSLTARGNALVPRVAALADRNDEDFFGGLTADERRMLGEILMTLVAQRGLTSTPVD